MGRELTDVHMDSKPNGVVKSNGVVNSNGNPIDSEGTESKKYEVKECTAEKSVVENGLENQDVQVVKSTNVGADIPDEKNEKDGGQKSTAGKKLNTTESKSSGAGNTHVHQTTSKAGANGTISVTSTPSPTATKNSEVTKILE